MQKRDRKDSRAPESSQVFFKLREARHFLGLMSDTEKKSSADGEPFRFYVSAFLSALRSAELKLIRVVHKAKGPEAAKQLEDELERYAEGQFLTVLRDTEVHGYGATMRRANVISVRFRGSSPRISGRGAPRRGRWLDQRQEEWQFVGRWQDAIILCQNVFNALESRAKTLPPNIQ